MPDPATPAHRESTTTCRMQSRGAPTWSSISCSRRSRPAPCWWRRSCGGWASTARCRPFAAAAISLVFISLTAVVLIVDLERPERFYYILTRSNWRSWLVWGSWFLTAHGILSFVWLGAAWFGWDAVLDALIVPVAIVAVLATSYTGFLFAQGLARDLWQGPSAAFDLIAQSLSAGSAILLLIAVLMGGRAADAVPILGTVLAASLIDASGDPGLRAPARAEPDAPSRAGRRDDPARRIRATVLGRRGGRRRPSAGDRLVDRRRVCQRPAHIRRRRCWRSPAARRGNTSGSRRDRACPSRRLDRRVGVPR